MSDIYPTPTTANADLILPSAAWVERELGVPVASIIRLEDLVEHLETSEEFGDYLSSVRRYREQYGLAAA